MLLREARGAGAFLLPSGCEVGGGRFAPGVLRQEALTGRHGRAQRLLLR